MEFIRVCFFLDLIFVVYCCERQLDDDKIIFSIKLLFKLKLYI